MVISLPVPAALKKETAEKTYTVNLSHVSEKLTINKLFSNKLLNAFMTVLQAPVK